MAMRNDAEAVLAHRLWSAEVAYLRRWLDARISWMNRALPARTRRGR
jgi:hypothetical protein